MTFEDSAVEEEEAGETKGIVCTQLVDRCDVGRRVVGLRQAGGSGRRTGEGGAAGGAAGSQAGAATDMRADLANSHLCLQQHLPPVLKLCRMGLAEQTRGTHLTQTDPDSVSKI